MAASSPILSQRLKARPRNGPRERLIHEYGEKLFALAGCRRAAVTVQQEGLLRHADGLGDARRAFQDAALPLRGRAADAHVLPAKSPATSQEYLGDEQLKLSPALRLGLKAAGGASWLFGAGVKAQVTGMARQFMLGNDEKEIAATLRKLHEQGIAFTVDVLGETVVSEAEADQYAQRYLALMDFLATGSREMAAPCQSNESPQGRYLPPSMFRSSSPPSIPRSTLPTRTPPSRRSPRGSAPSSAGRRSWARSSTWTWRVTR